MKYDKDLLIELICKHCDFYKESDEDLECGAYRILQRLLERGVVKPREIEDVNRP